MHRKSKKPRLLIFASGTSTGGGSGLRKLIDAQRNGILEAEIVGVVSTHPNGGVHDLAYKHCIPFVHFKAPWSAEIYQMIANRYRADFFALSGWLKLVAGLDPNTRFNSRTVFNIHPGPLPKFGGPGMYGRHVHKAVLQAFREGKLTHSAVTMHFVTKEYNRGPIFLNSKVQIFEGDTPENLDIRTSLVEDQIQYRITNLVVSGRIKWDGVNPKTLVVPDGYKIERSA